MKTFGFAAIVLLAPLVLLGANVQPGAIAPNSSFFDHFDAGTLDPRWTSILSGRGDLDIQDSTVECTSPSPADACAYYFATRLDKTQSQLFVFAQSNVTGTSPQWWLSLVDSPLPPIADTFVNWHPKLRAQVSSRLSGITRGIVFSYWDSAHVEHQWHGATNVWRTAAGLSNSPVAPADYYLNGIEFDGPNNRWRMLSWARRTGSTSYTFNQGLRLYALSNWVPWSSMEDSDDLWLVIGDPVIDAYSGTLRTEWARLDAGAKRDVWVNGKATLADEFHIRHGWGYANVNGGVEFIVPEDRSTITLSRGSGWDARFVKDPFVFFEPTDASYYLFYAGGGTQGVQIGLARSVSANGPFTRVSSSPLIPRVAGTSEDAVFGPALVKDEGEPDPQRRYQLLYTGLHGSAWRIHLATAPALTGPWLRRGVVLDVGPPGAIDQNGYSRPRPVFHNGRWYVFLSAKNENDVDVPFRVTFATGPRLDALTRSGVTLVDRGVAPTHNLAANLNGNTVVLDSTAGLTPDGYVSFDQDANSLNYGQSRIRKIINSTTLELYHGLDGFKSSYPARISQVDGAQRIEIADIQLAGNTWYMYVTPFQMFGGLPGYGAYAENTGLLTAPTITGPYTWNHIATPPFSRTRWGLERSAENLSFVHGPINTSPFTSLTTGRFMLYWPRGLRGHS